VRSGRNYFSILPFKAESGRNATRSCLYQAPSWLRGLIRPAPGTGLIYADYSQEEYYIAALLADDPEMQRLYTEGDPYIAFGVTAGLMPPGATKRSHPQEREIVKTVSLAVMYGQQVPSMARKLGISINRAEDLLRAHQQRFPQVWRWFDRQIMLSYARERAITRMGWYLKTGPQVKPRTLRNFPVQGTGADVLRLAHILLFEAGIRVCCPVHDAFLIETKEADLEKTKEQVCTIMAQAGRYVLGEHSVLRADARILRYPQRLLESKGEAVWNRVLGIVNRQYISQNICVPGIALNS
jgi:DNA polymerase I-like protein with 3'-5' exonuclease and polymerase domains